MDKYEEYLDFLKKSTKTYIVSTITIHALAHDRSIEIYDNGSKHNIATIDLLIEKLQEASEFVLEENPKWAQRAKSKEFNES
jgi:hypothetical protein